jgi:hypothetical protein
MNGRRSLYPAVAAVAGLALLELLLRAGLEQWAGMCQQVMTPSPLHHAPHAGAIRQRLEPPEKYGRFAGLEYEEKYDELGIKSSSLRPQEGEGTRILFLGDSFIEGYDEANTVPQRAYDWLMAHRSFSKPLIVLNAGYSSYSPVIFTVQARRLLPVLRPDLLVVDIDETDLYDDAVRYRGLVVRDRAGKAVAVGREPYRQSLIEGCAQAGRLPLYLLRLPAMLFYQWRLNRLQSEERLFAVGETRGELPAELHEQMEYFSGTLDELFTTLAEHLPAKRILVVRHPHLRHLNSSSGGAVLNRKVGDLVGAAAARHGISFFDAQDELEARFGSHPEPYYWKNDMHFNFDGMRAYGELVGREIGKKLDED